MSLAAANASDLARAPFPRRGAFAVLAAFALLLSAAIRLPGLGFKPLMHDESLFAYYSHFVWRFVAMDYDPLLHGPLLQQVNAVVFSLLGDTDFTVRLFCALCGIGVSALIVWRRPLRDPAACLLAALFCAVSPTLCYYSRFCRNDMPFAFFTVLCLTAFVEYARGGRRGWGMTAVLALATLMCIKENVVFLIATVTAFSGLWAAVDLGVTWRRHAARRATAPAWPPRLLNRILIGWNVGLLLLVPLTGWLASRAGWRGTTVALLLVALSALFIGAALFAATARRAIPGDAWRETLAARAWRRMKADRYPFAIALALSLALFLMVYNYWQIGRFNPLGGLAALAERLRDRETPVEWFRSANSDATVGTLDAWGIVERAVSYWWGQHAEHRLRGPFHYYIPLLAVYEWPLALMAMAGTLGALGRRRRRWLLALGLALAAALGGWLAAGTLGAARLDDLLHVQSRAHLVAAAALGAHATLLTVFYLLDGRVMRAFLLFWTVTTLAAVSYAGEKTPWLTVHVALPLALMAADAMVAAGAGWMRRGVGHRWRRGARRAAAALLAAGALVGGLKWSLDLGRLLADAHNPAERLVYNHTTPAVKVCAERIRQMDARFRAQGRRCEIGMTGEVPWPMYWYLRELDYREISGQTIDAADAEVVLCNPEHAIDADNFRRDYLTRTLPLRVAWVPPTVSPGRCFLAGADGEDWPMEPPAGARKEIAWLWRYWLRRELFPQPKPAHVTEFVVGWRRPAAAATDGLDGMDGMDTMDSMDGMDGMSYHGPTGGNPAESNSATSLVGPAIP